ncbi:MAG TPA: alpha-glucan family phosphorylase [Gemmatimonadaceae bacterium]|nr:alpha-glucan family phosphorylase [Gemmatimonadaceae bacterium]
MTDVYMNGATQSSPSIAYFSMEICLDQAIPTYSGGLGVLAGDTLRSAADLKLPMTGVTLLHRKGYFRQRLDQRGNQTEGPVEWRPEEILQELPERATVIIEGRDVQVRAWRYAIRGVTGHEIPVLLLDTALPENSEYDQTLTDSLYGGDSQYRLCQEVVLGIGGAQLLRATGAGLADDARFHMNEGHSALLSVMLLEWQLEGRKPFELTEDDIEAVRRLCVFTTHTPVPAGHDRFPPDLVRRILGAERLQLLEAAKVLDNGELNMTHLALRLSRFVNGVAMKHREVSLAMFPGFPIDSITNGVHAGTWTSPAFQALLDRRIPEWRTDNMYLRYAVGIPLSEIRAAHAEARKDFFAEVARRSGVELDPNVFTMGFARRATPYKRADLMFTDVERLANIADKVGPVQIVFGGKAHPHDGGGKDLIRRIHDAALRLEGRVTVVYLENYEMALAAKMVAGVDLWINNPMKPLEASGTSGMKAALNGVPSLSVLDGWWIEGHVEGVTGWSIGSAESEGDQSMDAKDLYLKLERVILPLFYGLPFAYAQVMRSAIALNGSFFNTQRMVEQYVRNAYFPAESELGAPLSAEQAIRR